MSQAHEIDCPTYKAHAGAFCVFKVGRKYISHAARIKAAEASAKQGELEAKVQLLLGAIAAQDERERLAGEQCGVLWEESGCDWPWAVAEEVAVLRNRIAELEKQLCPTCNQPKQDWGICSNAFHLPAPPTAQKDKV